MNTPQIERTPNPLISESREQAGHTPGPWKVYLGKELQGCVHAPKICSLFQLAQCYFGQAITDEDKPYIVTQKEMRANAQLIASAPELLEACKAALFWIEGQVHLHGLTDSGQRKYDGDVYKLTAAIAKAEGK